VRGLCDRRRVHVGRPKYNHPGVAGWLFLAADVWRRPREGCLRCSGVPSRAALLGTIALRPFPVNAGLGLATPTAAVVYGLLPSSGRFGSYSLLPAGINSGGLPCPPRPLSPISLPKSLSCRTCTARLLTVRRFFVLVGAGPGPMRRTPEGRRPALLRGASITPLNVVRSPVQWTISLWDSPLNT
jgi:hypothetical protein